MRRIVPIAFAASVIAASGPASAFLLQLPGAGAAGRRGLRCNRVADWTGRDLVRRICWQLL